MGGCASDAAGLLGFTASPRHATAVLNAAGQLTLVLLACGPAPACGAEHEANQLAAQGGAAPDRSRLFIGVGRAEMNRTEFFQVGLSLVAGNGGLEGWGFG